MKTVLITGGSQGLGLEMAKCFVMRQDSVILVSRSEEKLAHAREEILQKVPHADVSWIAMDLSVTGSAKALYQKVKETGKQIDILVNNAGAGCAGRSWEIDLDREERMAVLNDVSLMSLCKLYLKEMTERHSGTILNIGSTGAYQPGPYLASYYASKSFVLSYTRAIAEEAKSYGVKVFCFCPGPVDTGFFETSGGHRPPGCMSASDAAEKAVRMLDGHKTTVIPGWVGNCSNLLPSGLRMKIVKRMKERYLKKDKSNENK